MAALVFSTNAAKNTQNTSQMGKNFAIDWTNRSDKKSKVYIYRLPKATENRSKWIAAIHTDSSQQNMHLQLLFCQYVEFWGKTILILKSVNRTQITSRDGLGSVLRSFGVFITYEPCADP